MRKLYELLIVALTLSGLAFNVSAQEDPIRVGVLYPVTGFGQIFGGPALLGHELMVENINESGGLLGRQIVTIHRDTKLNPSDATAAARDLIAKDEVDFLVGGVSSSVGQAVSEVARQEKVIYIAAIPKTTKMTDKENFHPYVFRAAANSNTEGKSAAVIADRLGMNKICTILMDYSYGHSLSEAFIEYMDEHRPDAEIVLQVWPTQGTTDYTSYISQIMQADCDGVFSGVWGALFPPFAKQAKTFGFFEKVKYVSAGEIASPEVAQELGEDMPSGIWGNSYEVFYYPDAEAHNNYVEELREKTGEEFPSAWPSTGYIAMQWLAAGVEKAGTTETEAVIKALEGLTIQTPIGEQTMRAADHQANRGQFWGQMSESNIDGYDAKIMNPVEYIPADDLMD